MKRIRMGLLVLLVWSACTQKPETFEHSEVEVFQLFGLTEGLEAVAMVQTDDGSDLVILNNSAPNANSSPTILTTGINGTERQMQSIAVPDANRQYFSRSLLKLADGGFLIAGTAVDSQTDPFIIFLDADGDFVGSEFPGNKNDGFVAATHAPPGGEGFLFAGSRFDGRNNDILLIKTDAKGRYIDSDTSNFDANDFGVDLATSSEGYFLFGFGYRHDAIGATYDLIWRRLNAKGGYIDGREFDGGKEEIAVKMVPLEDGYLLIGNSYPHAPTIVPGTQELVADPGNIPGYYLVAIDIDGKEIWEQHGPSGLRARDAVVHPDGRITLLCDTIVSPFDSDLYVLETGPQGPDLPGQRYGYTDVETATAILSTGDNELLITGATEVAGLRKTLLLRTTRDHPVSTNQ